jgi:hypothetical protein
MRKIAILLSAAVMLSIPIAALAEAAKASASSMSATAAASPCDTPRQYVKLINGGKYDSVGSLFAEDAVYMGPDGKTRRGSKDIGAFYARFLPKFKPELRASKFFAHGDECMMELENRENPAGEYIPTAVDHFTTDSAGKISRFIVYLRPGSSSTRALTRALSQSH